ncbi:MAG: N-acetyl sugar amidotransferase [Treponema sp.]|nr:N-acetyl sugar amidotransferase [Treponema sp.]
MKSCTRCVLPETHETIEFDNEGVCNVCRQAEKKHKEVDWDARGEMLNKIINEYKNKNQYDCIIPYSGGKDSTYQLLYVVTRLKLKPLVVRFDHWGFRPLINKNNHRIFKQLGVDVLQFTPNWKVVKQLMLTSLRETGDFCWHCHTGVFGYIMQISVKFNVPLVIFGESPAEYRAYTSFEQICELEQGLFEKMINLGINNDKMLSLLHGKVDRRDLMPYEFPPKEQLDKINSKAIWLGNYIKWDTKSNVEAIKKELGWKGQPVEGIPPEYDYEKIECMWQGIRDYCKLIKRGHGRTNHLMCIDIRAGRMDRDKAIKLCDKYDGKRPDSLTSFLKTLEISEDEFIKEIMKSAHPKYQFNPKLIKNGKRLPDADLWQI